MAGVVVVTNDNFFFTIVGELTVVVKAASVGTAVVKLAWEGSATNEDTPSYFSGDLTKYLQNYDIK